MNSELDRQKLELNIAKSVVFCGLRDTLSRIGIASDEKGILHIKYEEDIVLSHEIPKKSPRIAVPQQQTGCFEEINDFFDRTEAFNGFLSALPKSQLSNEGKTRTLLKVIFDVGSLQFGEPLREYPRLQITHSLMTCCFQGFCWICRD